MKTIMLHGLGQSAASWNDTLKYMDQTEDILCPELSKWIQHGMASYVSLYDGVEKYCEEVEGPLNLCGLSLGGILAMQYVIGHPDRVNSLVLIGTQYVMPKRLLKLQNLIFHLMPKGAFEGMGFEKKDLIDLCKSMSDLDFRAGLKQICCPVLIVCGERDKANKTACLQMKEKISNAKFLMIPGSGHEVNRDAPTVLGKELGMFFRAHS